MRPYRFDGEGQTAHFFLLFCISTTTTRSMHTRVVATTLASSMYELVCSYYARNINFNTQHACTMHTVCILRARVYMHTATLCSMHTRGVSIILIMHNMHTGVL